MITIKNLLHSLVAHLSRGEALQRHDGRVGPVAQQQLAGLDVTGQRSSMKSRLPERVHGVHLESEEATLTYVSCVTPDAADRKWKNTTHLCSMFLQHLQDVVVSSLSSNMQGSHEAGRHDRQEVTMHGRAGPTDTFYVILSFRITYS